MPRQSASGLEGENAKPHLAGAVEIFATGASSTVSGFGAGEVMKLRNGWGFVRLNLIKAPLYDIYL